MTARLSSTATAPRPSRIRFGLHVAGAAGAAVAAILTVTLASGAVPTHLPGPMTTWASVGGT